MKKKPLIFLLVFAFLFSGCKSGEPLDISPYSEVDTLEDIWIEVDPETVSSSGTKIIIYNTSDRDDFFTGLWFCIEVNKDGIWYSLPYINDGVGFPTPDIPIPTVSEINAGFIDGIHYDSNSKVSWRRFPPNEMNCQWEHMYGELPKGDYRLIISLASYRDLPSSEDSPEYYLSAHFPLTDVRKGS